MGVTIKSMDMYTLAKRIQVVFCKAALDANNGVGSNNGTTGIICDEKCSDCILNWTSCNNEKAAEYIEEFIKDLSGECE